jgi:hypothetical protein
MLLDTKKRGKCSHIKIFVHHFLLPSPFKPFSCLGSRPFSIFWNRKKFVLPFPRFCSNLYRIFMVLDIKNFVQKSSISPAFSPVLPLLFFTIFLMLLPALNPDLSVFIRLLFNLNYVPMVRILAFNPAFFMQKRPKGDQAFT